MQVKQAIGFIVNWLNDYSNNSKTNGFVIGISGGIDSAVTSTLCAMTGKNVICLNMPIRQHKAEYDRACGHIEWLQNKFPLVTSNEIELTEVFKKFEQTIPTEIQDWLTMANTRARLRMTTLYSFACHHKMLVVGTGNKVEDFGVGFFTKYGDGGVDISPIADLMKSEVYAVAKEMRIVESIQEAAPTDGLWADSRTDEQQIGATYDELEWAMKFLESPGSFSGISEKQKKALDIYEQFNKANLHKMSPVPICILPAKLKIN